MLLAGCFAGLFPLAVQNIGNSLMELYTSLTPSKSGEKNVEIGKREAWGFMKSINQNTIGHLVITVGDLTLPHF